MTKRQHITRIRRIIGKYVGEHRRELILVSVAGVISAAANGLAPLLVGRFIDAILQPGTIRFFGTAIAVWVFLLVLWGAAQLVAAGADWFVMLRGGRLGERLHVMYLQHGFASLICLPLSFHKGKRSGNVVSQVQRGAAYLDRLVREIADLAPQLLSILVGVGIAVYINVWASLPMIIGVIVYLVLLRRNFGNAGRARRHEWRTFHKAFGISHDMVHNVESVKHFTAEQYASKLIARKFRTALKWAQQSVGIWSKVGLQQKVLVIAVQLSVFVISVLLIQTGDMTVGELIALNGYAGMFFGPFVQLGRRIDFFQEASVGLGKAETILSSRQEQYTPRRATTLDTVRGEITFENVSFSYKPKDDPVLKDANLRVTPGQTLALVGESGVGKSTLVDMIGGFYFPSKGRVLIDGHNVRRLDLESLRNHISYVPQDVLLFHESVYNNIRFARPSATREEVEDAVRRARAHEFIEQFPRRYNTVVGERGVKLSTGQRQRIAIARVILRDPGILILDEPTSALDAKTEKTLTDSLEELMRGRTTIVIAHRLSTVRRADTIAAVKNGCIEEIGSHEELIARENGVYRELYDLQFDTAS